MSEQEIHNLISDILSGNQRAFADLVDEYKHMVYALCHKMCQDATEAEEIAQDAFVKAYTGLNKFKGKSKFSTWLYQITYFTAINHLRKRSLEIDDQFINWELEPYQNEEHPLEKEDQRKLINTALSYLKPKERAVINLFYLEELELKEVAEITKMSLSNVKVSLYRARKKLYVIMSNLTKNELNFV